MIPLLQFFKICLVERDLLDIAVFTVIASECDVYVMGVS